jgi:hypothetical protein
MTENELLQIALNLGSGWKAAGTFSQGWLR